MNTVTVKVWITIVVVIVVVKGWIPIIVGIVVVRALVSAWVRGGAGSVQILHIGHPYL